MSGRVKLRVTIETLEGSPVSFKAVIEDDDHQQLGEAAKNIIHVANECIFLSRGQTPAEPEAELPEDDLPF